MAHGIEGAPTSSPVPPKNVQPPPRKNSYGLSLIVFMMGPQFRLTGPSASGMSTELQAVNFCALVADIKTHSSQFLTSSSCMLGMELM